MPTTPFLWYLWKLGLKLELNVHFYPVGLGDFMSWHTGPEMKQLTPEARHCADRITKEEAFETR